MFRRVAENDDSGRTIQKWFDEIGFTTRSGKKVGLSLIYIENLNIRLIAELGI
ncbi:hypothetical protein HYW42_02300 [Candidatus Daviesbacteria bacterium]|nr:hypothetical protein [Candidatus Daviesbacteria bacterium]